jgi:hypothetical protein
MTCTARCIEYDLYCNILYVLLAARYRQAQSQGTITMAPREMNRMAPAPSDQYNGRRIQSSALDALDEVSASECDRVRSSWQ